MLWAYNRADCACLEDQGNFLLERLLSEGGRMGQRDREIPSSGFCLSTGWGHGLIQGVREGSKTRRG